MKYGDKGPDVESIQKSLLSRGYELPVYGADGHLGNETWDALHSFSKDSGLAWSPEVPFGTIDELKRPAKPDPDVPGPDGPFVPTVPFLDLRDEQKDPHPKSKTQGNRTVRRAPSAVTGVTLHQTAVKFSVSSSQIAAAGGDRQLALARRGLNVACHAMAFHDGFFVATAPLDWYIYHGNGLNSYELGLEVDGLYPGLRGGSTWNGDPATIPTEASIAAAREALRWLVETGRSMGMPIEFLHAHRQSSSSRRADPGQELWEAIVLDYAVPVLGLKTRLSDVVGDGRPVPVDWDPNGLGKY
jgi:hypothetical protein